MNKNEILQNCIIDRTNSFEHQELSWYKKNAIDLVVKFYILLFNSFGLKNPQKKAAYIFVDEVKNVSMINNLSNTREAFAEKGLNTYKVCFNKIDRKNHLRLGIFHILILFLGSIFSFLKTLLTSLWKEEKLPNRMMNVLIRYYIRYLDQISDMDAFFLLMSDHHFFSTVTAACYERKSAVLQHGLVMDKRFYYPIRAGHFFAWGEKSKKLLNNDERVTVTGTYKFGFAKNMDSDFTEVKDILFCISSLDKKIVKDKIDCLYKLAQKHRFHLSVKCHPGSLFKVDYWKSLYKDTDISFYQEELLRTIKFDLAVPEGSTIIIDLLAMNKPFILFDKPNGYFEEYSDIMPHGDTFEKIERCIQELSGYDFKEINRMICRAELNECNCDIIDVSKRFGNV